MRHAAIRAKGNPFVVPMYWVRQENSHEVSVSYVTLQGCQMVCFQTQNPNLGKFWRALEWKMLVHFTGHLEHFMAIR
jgi:hypothetical protein